MFTCSVNLPKHPFLSMSDVSMVSDVGLHIKETAEGSSLFHDISITNMKSYTRWSRETTVLSDTEVKYLYHTQYYFFLTTLE